MAKYTGELMDDFYDDYNNKLLPYIVENLPWQGVQVYWFVDDIDGEYQLDYGVRDIGSFGEIDRDKDLEVHTFNLDIDPDWLEFEYGWQSLSDKEKAQVIAEMISWNY